MKTPTTYENISFSKVIGGGQSLGELPNGKKVFAWGVLPDETANITQTKKKSSYIEAVAYEVTKTSPHRVEAKDPESYLSTSPWQIISDNQENHYKAALIEEAFEMHNIVLPNPIEVYSDGRSYGYRNKIEFSWWWDNDTNQLDLAFFRRGTKGKIPVEGTSLAMDEINQTGRAVRDILRKRGVEAFDLKTIIIRSNSEGRTVFQLYLKTKSFVDFSSAERDILPNFVDGYEIIFSNPKSPASVITKRLHEYGEVSLTDKVLSVPFTYAAEGFFQINIPVYEQALKDMKEFIPEDKRVIDFYSGVGSIGLTIAPGDVTLIESNEYAVREMKRNIESLGINAHAIHATSEDATEYITKGSTIIVDPPRAGLHQKVIDTLLAVQPSRIIYLSCNPTTQARDVELLGEEYGVLHHKGYNFFPQTPHIEHLVVLDLKNQED